MEIINVINICVPIVIGIMSIAFPISITHATKIGEKFNSKYLKAIFDETWPQRKVRIPFTNFRIPLIELSLYTTIGFLIPLIIPFSPPSFLMDFDIVNNSAYVISFLLAVQLTVVFFWWIRVLNEFSNPIKLILPKLTNDYERIYGDVSKSEPRFNWLSKFKIFKKIFGHYVMKNESDTPVSKNDKKKADYQRTIIEIALYGQKDFDGHIQRTILNFFYKLFKDYNNKHTSDKALEYDAEMYQFVRIICAESIKNNGLAYPAMEHRAVSGAWLLGTYLKYNKVSERTYNALWGNIIIIGKKARFVKMFWENSVQYYEMNLQEQFEDALAKSPNLTPEELKNSDAVRFKEFHYAMGGLMLHFKNYRALEFMLSYTNSIPPQYPMLPSSMDEVFLMLSVFADYKSPRGTLLDSQDYPFPGLDNLGNKDMVQNWIGQYLAVLFIWMYRRPKFLKTQNFTQQPSLPMVISDLKYWQRNARWLKEQLDSVIINKELLKALQLEQTVDEKEQYIAQYFSDFEVNLKGKIEESTINAPIDKEKKQNFKNKTFEILTRVFDDYGIIFNSVEKNNEAPSLIQKIIGSKFPFPRIAFIKGGENHGNYDTILATAISNSIIKPKICRFLKDASTRGYLLTTSDAKHGVKKVIGDTRNVIVIVSQTLDWGSKSDLKEFCKIEGIKHKEIPASQAYADKSIYILRQSHLPLIEFQKPDNADRYQLDFTEENKYNIGVSLIDLADSKNESIKEEWKHSTKKEDLDASVQLNAFFKFVMSWPQEREMVRIEVASPSQEQGILNEISELTPLAST